MQEKKQLEEELGYTTDAQRKTELTEKLKEVLGQYNIETSEWEKRVNQAEEKVKNLETKKRIIDGTYVMKKKQTLNLR